MRLVAVTLAFALLSLAFAPAPLPKRDRETAIQKEKREVAECARLLGELGVKWSVVTGPDGQVVRYSVEVSQPNRSGSMSGECGVAGDLPRTLRLILRQTGAFVRNEGRY